MNIHSAAAAMRFEPAEDYDFWTIHVPANLRAELFPLGEIHIFDARDTLPAEDIFTGLVRHGLGDWGLAPPQWRARNDRALRGGRPSERISVYASAGWAIHFFVITKVSRRGPGSGVFLAMECPAFASAF
jgi:hypothetical protein